MALDIGGFEQRSDWPKMGPSLLIGTCLILAIRTAKWPAIFDERCSEMDLDREIAYAAQLAGRVLAALVGRHESIFPSRMEPWYQATDEGSPKGQSRHADSAQPGHAGKIDEINWR